jgi:hypothetical protein
VGDRIVEKKGEIMKRPLLILLSLALLVPFAAFGADQQAQSGKDQATVTTAASQSSAPALQDFAQWYESKLSPTSSGCGPNFCTQAQRTACAKHCRHAPFVGLECCTDTCTSFCNCGSVPTGC